MPLHGKGFKLFSRNHFKNVTVEKHANFSIIPYQFQSVSKPNKVFPFPGFFCYFPTIQYSYINKPLQHWRTWILFVVVSSLTMRDLIWNMKTGLINFYVISLFSITEEKNSSATTGGLQLAKSNMTNKFHIKYLKNQNVH